jgi:hypothetical protein
MKWRRIGWVRHIERMGANTTEYRPLVRKPEGRSVVGRLRSLVERLRSLVKSNKVKLSP